MIIFPVTLILNLLFPFLSPTYIQVQQEQRPEELWTEVTLYFCIVSIHRDYLAWNCWSSVGKGLPLLD